MRVQFIWFNLNATPKMSLGVAILVRELVEAGHTVAVMHLNEEIGTPFDLPRIVETLRAFDPGLVALSFGRNHLQHATELLAALKRELPHVPRLCGGVHATLMPEEMIALDTVDYVCLGEADGLMVPFVSCLETGEGIAGLPGFWDKTCRNPMAPLPDISQQTWIDLDHIDHASALAYNRGMFEVVSGRGCPGACTFCFNPALRAAIRRHLPQGPGRPYCRKRGVENLLEEMEAVLDRLGDKVKMFSFADDAFNTDREWTLSFCSQYSGRIQRPYACNILIERVDEEVARALKQSGAIVKIGVESGSERIRCEILGKSFDNASVERGHRLLRAEGVPTRIYLMVGNPSETREEILATFAFVAGLRPTSTRLCIFYPVEGSPIYQRCLSEGLLTGREYENYDDLSVLRWEPEMTLFLEKVHDLHPWMQNMHLGEVCAREYGPLLSRAMGMSEREWHRKETTRFVRSVSRDLSQKLRRQGVPHYFNPFPERPDVAFLYSDQPVGLPNVDE